MKAVFRHELSSYFTGMTGYVFGAFLLLFAGIYTMAVNLNAGLSNFEYVLSNLSFIFLIIVHILTMRVIAEERRQRTDQLLYSLPLSMTGVALGKYAALLVVFLVPTGISPGARFHQFFDSLESGQFPSLVYISICLAGFLSGFDQLMDLFFDLFQLFFIGGIHLFQGFAHLRHLLEISRHRVKTHLTSSSRMSYFASGAGTLMKAWPGSISSRISLITAGSGASSSTALDTSWSNPVFSRTSSGEEVG